MYLPLIVACGQANEPKDTSQALDSGAIDAGSDADGDGIAQEKDCNDDNPSPATAVETYSGDVNADNLAGFCEGYCVRNVDGDVAANGTTLSYLYDLRCVQTISGALTIANNDALDDVTGITEVPGDVTLYGNVSLKDLGGLDGVTRIGGDLRLEQNGRLHDVAELSNVTTLSGDLDILDNAELLTADAEALRDAIDSIGGTVTISGNAP